MVAQFILAKESFLVINSVYCKKKHSHIIPNGLDWNRLARKVASAKNIYNIPSSGELKSLNERPNLENVTKKYKYQIKAKIIQDRHDHSVNVFLGFFFF